MSIEFTGPNGYRYLVKNQGMYSDGTPMVKMDIEDVAQKANSMTLKPASLMEFVTAMFLVDAVRIESGDRQLSRLVMPYVPGARQDRINYEGDVLFTIFSVSQMLDELRFDEVVILDPHSEVASKFIENAVEYPLELIANKFWMGYTGIIAPDKGAADRANQFATALSKRAGRNYPVHYGEKTRDVSTGRLSGFSIDGLRLGGHYLVVDDICDGGGTFVGLGEKIRAQGAFADLFVTHGIFSKGAADLKKIYKSIYTTDSLNNNAHGVYTIPIVADMENY